VRREKLEAQKRSTHGVPFTSVVILSRLKDGEGSQRYQGHRSIRRAPELKNNRLLVFAELLAQRVGNFADGGVGLDSGEDGRD
jgi:hypothetical protein